MKNCRRFISVLLTAVLLCSQLSISALAEGTEAAAHSYDANGFCTDAGCTAYQPAVLNEDSIYEIGNAGQLYWFAALVNGTLTDGTEKDQKANAKLTADIVVNESVLAADGSLNGDGSNFRVWTPIGDYDNQYSGTFDGCGMTISGLYFNDPYVDADNPGTNYVGLFGSAAVIKNVGVIDSYFNAGQLVGAVCGYNGKELSNCHSNSTVIARGNVGGICGTSDGKVLTNCRNEGKVTSTFFYAGGICGRAGYWGPSIDHCSNSGTVECYGSDSSQSVAGGICGLSRCGVTYCSNTGSIVAHDFGPVGGIVGRAKGGQIRYCYNTGDITALPSDYGSRGIGGICGHLEEDFGVRIQDCYNTGAIKADSGFIGGLAGCGEGYSGYDVYYASILNSHNLGTITVDNPTISTKIGAICGYSYLGKFRYCHYVNDCDPVGTTYYAKETLEQRALTDYKEGELCWLLNRTITVNTEDDTTTITPGPTDGTQGWYQTLGVDAYPVIDNTHEAVLMLDATTYTNAAYNEAGFCTFENYPDFYQPAVLNGDVYEISNAGQLYWFAKKVNGGTSLNGKLMNDITINKNVLVEGGLNPDETVVAALRPWTPIGNYEKNFTGTFDGNGKTIRGLYQAGSDSLAGLFGVNNGGTIKDVTVEDSYLSTENSTARVGAICASNAGSISGCINSASLNGTSITGGIVGLSDGAVSDCKNSGSIRGIDTVGGICGSLVDESITDCENTGIVQSNIAAGGICGYSRGTATITNCHNMADLTGSDTCGGICGESFGVKILTCHNEGNLTGGYYVGGICGNSTSSSNEIRHCYNVGSVNSTMDSATQGSKDIHVGGICGYMSGSVYDSYNTGTLTVASETDYFLGSICGKSSNSVQNCYYLDTEDIFEGTAKTSGQFASGEVCWLLNGGENQSVPLVWYQTCGEGIPKFSGDTVYRIDILDINNNSIGNDFSNTKENITASHTITFDANGGTGSIESITLTANASYALPECTFTAPDGSDFECWSVDGTQKAEGDEITVSKDVTVTAVWTTRNGITPEGGEFKYYENGIWIADKYAYVDFKGESFIVAHGKVVLDQYGLTQDPNNKSDWYFVSVGRVVREHSGLCVYDEAWFYVQNGKLDTTYNGYVDYNGGKFLVAEGRIVREAKGLVQDPNNAADWYYLADGQVVSYTGLTLYDEEWFYVENGKLASDYTGNVDYNGSTFYVANGMLAENN